MYYSVALAADDLGGTDRYANYILTSLVDFPAVLFGIYACRRYYCGSLFCQCATRATSLSLPRFHVWFPAFHLFVHSNDVFSMHAFVPRDTWLALFSHHIEI